MKQFYLPYLSSRKRLQKPTNQPFFGHLRFMFFIIAGEKCFFFLLLLWVFYSTLSVLVSCFEEFLQIRMQNSNKKIMSGFWLFHLFIEVSVFFKHLGGKVSSAHYGCLGWKKRNCFLEKVYACSFCFPFPSQAVCGGDPEIRKYFNVPLYGNKKRFRRDHYP